MRQLWSHHKVNGKSFFSTLIYAFNEGKDRIELWRCLNQFASFCTGPWALAGDFNIVLNPEERLGGQTRDEDMDEFVDCMNTCGMIDIQATRAFFSWTNKQDAEHRKNGGSLHPEGLLDHNPCVISNKNLVATRYRSFKYFNMWGSAADFLPRVKEVLDSTINGTRMFCIVKKLKGLKAVLNGLNKECYSDIEIKTGEAEQGLADIQTQIIVDPTNHSLITREKDAMENLRVLTKARDSFLRQKSKIK
ncbi:uncharacterized protein LOC141619046 [Silene latifolia]|uniref:uncharacterized protein LOC141619046 n=1 Tax=Silene latifolia TaxID=37657 RepID=UPI003D7767E8